MNVALSEALGADPVLPQRNLLLDGGAMADRLSGSLTRGSLAVERCTPLRAKYQPGRSLRVLYRVTTERSRDLVALRTFEDRRGAEVCRQAEATAVPSETLRPVAHNRDLGAVLFTFPNDRKVHGLRAFGGARRELGGGRLVSYAPEKGATFRLTARDGRTVGFAKAYADGEGERTRLTHDALSGPAAALGLRLPRVVAYSREQRTLVTEAIGGRPLAALTGAALSTGLKRLGASLAALHGLERPPAAPPFARVDPGRLEHAVGAIADLRPDCEVSARSLLEQLAQARPSAADPCCLHGDVHLKNAIVAAGGVALVDLDQVAAGPPAADLGSLLAALRYRALVGSISRAEEATLERALLAGYATVREPPERSALDWHLAAALLGERALRAITRLRVPGLLCLPRLLADAEATAVEATAA